MEDRGNVLRGVLVASVLAVLGLGLSGCKSIAALKQRCLAGEASACESACNKGIPGEGGCFHAGNLRRERAALDFGGSDFRRATEYFGRSCDGGYADGCLLAGELIAAPYAPEPGAEKQKTISDAEVKTREKRFEQACARGSSTGCKRLGDVLIGKNAERAKAAYAKACAPTSAAEDCKKARENEVDQAEKWRMACTRRVADDCTRLGDVLYQVDPPRAVRLFVSECQLRGVAQVSGGLDAFVRQRIEGARVFAEPPRPTPSPAPAYALDVLSPAVDGAVALTEVLRAFAAHAAELSACVELDGAHTPSEVGVELVVDETGDTFRSRISPGSVPSAVARCIEAVTEAFAFTPPPAAALVTAALRIRPTPDASAAKK